VSLYLAQVMGRQDYAPTRDPKEAAVDHSHQEPDLLAMPAAQRVKRSKWSASRGRQGACARARLSLAGLCRAFAAAVKARWLRLERRPLLGLQSARLRAVERGRRDHRPERDTQMPRT